MSNNNVTTKQLQIIQTICSGKFSSRDERLEFFSEFLFREVNSTKDLSKNEADDIITYLQTGKVANSTSYALFDKSNPRHMKILSLARELDWIDEKTGYADLNRLGGWIKSARCPIQGKKLKEMTYEDISKVIKALENMVKSKWK
ncbi:hypothetical protein HX001_18020 [Empedobacter brevis]|uniref:Uncharacterized protein n=1 Tax=Empedobacter brevis TaxID=247 RepID=A0AAJ1QI17_9FLAO|nr:hypothetical protein [Empedobacter brevis]MDM1074379.1 hypothetical protein [Empedobacter brevis]